MTEADYAQSDDWSLTSAQVFFMLQNHNPIEIAFAEGDLNYLRDMVSSPEFQGIFGDMGFDEAYDRYEEFLGLT